MKLKKLGMVIGLSLIIYCNNYNSDKYTLAIDHIKIERSNQGHLDGNLLIKYLSQYNYHGNSAKLIYQHEAGSYKHIRYQVLIGSTDNHIIDIDLQIYEDNKTTDKWFNNINTLCFDQPLQGFKDAILVPLPKCGTGAGYEFIFSNTFAIIYVLPHGKSEVPPEEREAYFKLRDKLFYDFLKDFYPFFIQCTEKSQVQVGSESNK